MSKSLALVLIAGATLIAYANAPLGGFVYDDHFLIEGNALVTGRLDPARIFQTSYWGGVSNFGLYRPLSTLSFALIHKIDPGPAGQHVVNILLHLLASILLYLVLLRIGIDPAAALAGSLLFAVHPVHTEAVTGIVGRPEILACLFLILSLWLALPPVTPNRWGISLALFLLALLSKESAIVLLGLHPLVLLVTRRLDRTILAPLGGMIAVVLVWAWMRHNATGQLLGPTEGVTGFVVNPLAHVGLLERWGTAIANLGRYLLLLLLPVNLSVDYSYNRIPVVGTVLDPVLLISIVAIVAGTILCRKKPMALLGIGWMLLAILPASNLVFPIGTIFAERLLYLPSVGFCVIAGLLLARIPRGKVSIPILAGISILFVAGTFTRNADWKDDESLLLAAARSAPESAKVQYELGALYVRQAEAEKKDYEEKVRLENLAIRAYLRATEIYPDYAEAHYDRANIYRRQEEIDVAILDYREAIRADPGFFPAYHNLGLVLLDQNHLDDAVQSLWDAVRTGPDSVAASLDLAMVLPRMDQPEEAIGVLQRLLERDPPGMDDSLRAEVHIRMAVIYLLNLKDREAALRHVEEARRLDPDHKAMKEIDRALQR